MKLTGKLEGERGSAPPGSSTQLYTPTLSLEIETGKVLSPFCVECSLSVISVPFPTFDSGATDNGGAELREAAPPASEPPIKNV